MSCCRSIRRPHTSSRLTHPEPRGRETNPPALVSRPEMTQPAELRHPKPPSQTWEHPSPARCQLGPLHILDLSRAHRLTSISARSHQLCQAKENIKRALTKDRRTSYMVEPLITGGFESLKLTLGKGNLHMYIW
jgi:hypothetical protein